MPDPERISQEWFTFGQWCIFITFFSRGYPRESLVEITYHGEPLPREMKYQGGIIPKGSPVYRSKEFFFTTMKPEYRGERMVLSENCNFAHLPKELRSVILREVMG